MGLAEWGVRKIKGMVKKGQKDGVDSGFVEQQPDDRETLGVRQLPKKAKSSNPYRDAPLTTSDLTREELEKVLRELLQRRPGLEEDIKDLVGSVRDDISRQARMTLEDRLKEEGRLLTKEQQKTLHDTVKARFEKHNEEKKFIEARKGIYWAKVWAKLEENPDKMWSLNEMERTGGEPDVVGYDKTTGEYIFMDCSWDSPVGRTNVCFNREGQERAENSGGKPAGNAVDMAKDMGVKILREKEYRALQNLRRFDLKTWSWVVPDDMSEEEMEIAGRALLGSRRSGGVYVDQRNAINHPGNGAFRGSLRV